MKFKLKKYFVKYLELLSREFAFPENPSEKGLQTMELSFVKFEEYYRKYATMIVHNMLFYSSALPVYDIPHCHELQKCVEKYAQIIYLKTQGGEELTKQCLG